jgi:hypothetical protein
MKRGKPNYNADAREGDITDSLSRKLRSSQAVILVKFETHYTTWAPGGGKLIKQWFLDPTGYNAARFPEGKNYGDKIDADGNVVRQVPMYYVLAVDVERGTADPMSMAWGSTQAKKTRAVNSQARYDLIGADGLPFTPPIYSRLFDITSVLEGDGDNSWAGWNAEVAGLVLANEKFGELWYAKAEAFRDQIEKGNVRPQAPEGIEDSGDDNDEPEQMQSVGSASVGDVPASKKLDDDIPF